MPSDRLREHPADRFADQVLLVDLEEVVQELPGESRAGHGHIQKTLYRRGPCTTAIFSFDEGASLPEHRVDGEAIIHCLAGVLRVHAAGTQHTLGPNQILCLAPGVPHDLHAEQRSHFLLHVILGAAG